MFLLELPTKSPTFAALKSWFSTTKPVGHVLPLLPVLVGEMIVNYRFSQVFVVFTFD